MVRKTKSPPLSPIIFDTDVLIWYFRGDSKSSNLLHDTELDRRWVSSLTVMELLQGCRNKDEMAVIESFIAENISRIIHPRTSISEKAIHLVGEYALSHGLRVVDALLAASALLHRAVLKTGNSRHFRFIPGLKAEEFKR